MRGSNTSLGSTSLAAIHSSSVHHLPKLDTVSWLKRVRPVDEYLAKIAQAVFLCNLSCRFSAEEGEQPSSLSALPTLALF
ncbi:hypothetical protein V6N12_063534 [Hibiscus sabdariffa]|uniref:Uncharacterized protein n=1 Tax=Hibiscus sabdariffa TaxID=183260 RepID=A0ABR2FC62_9ROSI